MSICSECTTNTHLKERIQADGVEDYCFVCKQDRNKVMTVRELASVISCAMQQHFEFNPQRYFFRDEDQDYTQPYGDSLETVVSEMLGQDVDFFDTLLEAIAETTEYDFRDGEPDFFEAGALYAPIHWDYTQDYFNDHWHNLVAELKHQRRFFSEAVHEFFDGLFKGVDQIRAWNKKKQASETVIEYFVPITTMFRGRVVEPEDAQRVVSEPYKLVGPAPRNKARSGRMNPEGVVALYCAMEAETAIAELRPAIGSLTAVISMTPSRPLRLLNFKRLDRAMDEGWGAFLATDYPTVYNTRVFLRRLHKLISQPVVPGHESDYLITQTMAEYLAHVYKPGFDGIIFKSVQRSGGTNVVIFADKEGGQNTIDTFPVEYVKDSLEFHTTSSVAYTHQALEMTYESKAGMSLRPKQTIKSYPIGKPINTRPLEEGSVD